MEKEKKIPQSGFKKISAFEPGTVILGTVLSFLSAVVCMRVRQYLHFRSDSGNAFGKAPFNRSWEV